MIRSIPTPKQEQYENIVGETAPICLAARFSISQLRDRIASVLTQDVVRKRLLIKMWGYTNE